MNTIINENYEFCYAGLFSTDEKWIHPRRVESTYEIIYVTRGEVFLSEDGKDIHIKKGQLVLLEPNIPHEGSRESRDVSFYWLHFRVKDGQLPFASRFFESFESVHLFKELLHFRNLPSVPDYLVNASLMRILAEMCHLSVENGQKYDSFAEKIYEWIRINASARLKVGTVADHFGYSADHISRICKKNYGMGARELINKFLLLRAKALLSNTDKYVKEIAADLGFGDDKAFIGYFKYHEGCFPSEFRDRYGKLHMNNR